MILYGPETGLVVKETTDAGSIGQRIVQSEVCLTKTHKTLLFLFSECTVSAIYRQALHLLHCTFNGEFRFNVILKDMQFNRFMPR